MRKCADIDIRSRVTRPVQRASPGDEARRSEVRGGTRRLWDGNGAAWGRYKVWQRTYGPKARSAPCVVYPLPHETLSRCRDRRTRGFNLKKSVGRRPPGAPTIGNNLVYEKALAAHDATRPRTHTPIAFRKVRIFGI